MSKRIPVPTLERTRELDAIFRSARPIGDGPDFAMDAIRGALLRASPGKVPLGEAVFASLRTHIEAEVPQHARAIREVLTTFQGRPREPDDAYATAYAGFRLVDDVLMDHDYEPTLEDWSEIAYSLVRIGRLTRIGGMKIHVVETVWPRPTVR